MKRPARVKTPGAGVTMSVGDALLALLRCPVSLQPLERAPRELVGRLLALREAGSLRTRGGAVPAVFEDALVSADGSRIYPVRDGIPVLLAEEAL